MQTLMNCRVLLLMLVAVAFPAAAPALSGKSMEFDTDGKCVVGCV